MHIDKLDEIVNEYNNAYHQTINMKPIDVKTSMYLDLEVENNEKSFKFKVGHHVRIWNRRNVLQNV